MKIMAHASIIKNIEKIIIYFSICNVNINYQFLATHIPQTLQSGWDFFIVLAISIIVAPLVRTSSTIMIVDQTLIVAITSKASVRLFFLSIFVIPTCE
jgi:hypothetical protein